MSKQQPYNSPAVQRLAAELARLPGIGPRTAGRLVYHLLKGDKKQLLSLSEAFRQVGERVTACGVCGNFTENNPCRICTAADRDPGVLCVVEQPFDVLVIERTGNFRGKYHVLGGALSPINGVGPDDLRIESLMDRLRQGVQEVILATNPNVEGEATSLYLQKRIAPMGIKITQIARGLPIGSDLEYADDVTLARAFQGRVEI